MSEPRTIINSPGPVTTHFHGVPSGSGERVWLGWCLGFGLSAGVFTFLAMSMWLGRLHDWMGL